MGPLSEQYIRLTCSAISPHYFVFEMGFYVTQEVLEFSVLRLLILQAWATTPHLESAENPIQGCVHVEQALCQLKHIPSP